MKTRVIFTVLDSYVFDVCVVYIYVCWIYMLYSTLQEHVDEKHAQHSQQHKQYDHSTRSLQVVARFHVTYTYVMSRTNGSCHVHLSHVTYIQVMSRSVL